MSTTVSPTVAVPGPTPSPLVPPTGRSAVDTSRCDLHDLGELLEMAGRVDPSDDRATAQLRRRARAVLGPLIADGRLPRYLAVLPSDPGSVVIRTIVAAWRHVDTGCVAAGPLR